MVEQEQPPTDVASAVTQSLQEVQTPPTQLPKLYTPPLVSDRVVAR